MEKLSRKEREYHQRREEILNAAERIFAQKGFHETTVAAIARESEFSIGTLYQFFKNKEELYYTMMIEKFDQLYTMLRQEVDKNHTPLDKLSCLVTGVLSFIEQNVDFFKIFTWELNVLQPAMEARLKEQLIAKHFSYIRLIGTVVEEGIREGVLQEGTVDDYSAALVGMMNLFAFNWILNRQEDSLRTKGAVIINLFLHGIAARNAPLPLPDMR